MTRLIMTAGVLATVCSATALAEVGPVWTEIGDAGDLPGNSQKPVGIGPLGAIEGELAGLGPNFNGPGDFQDVYEIEILTPSFFIEAVPLTDGDPSFDLSLWLFDSAGLAIAGNLDKDPGGLANLAFPDDGMGVPIPPGTYFLAVSGAGSAPISVGGEMFFFDVAFPFEISGPDGVGASSPVFGWDAPEGLTGRYRLELTGIGFTDVPTPATAFGFAALLITRRRRRSDAR